MPWYSKEQPTPFDSAEIPGLEFLHGDVLAKRYRQVWVEGKKYPIITFPSGVRREVRSSGDNEGNHFVHLFGHMNLPYQATFEDAFEVAAQLATEHDYFVGRSIYNSLLLANPAVTRAYEVTFDERGCVANVTTHPPEAMELLTGEGRAILPPLYYNEPLGLEAVAPLKFFTPDSRWTWYPTEFDGDDLFFGLISGLAVELGYFSLVELESVRGPLGLPIERDLYFEPTSLRQLKALHQRRG